MTVYRRPPNATDYWHRYNIWLRQTRPQWKLPKSYKDDFINFLEKCFDLDCESPHGDMFM